MKKIILALAFVLAVSPAYSEPQVEEKNRQEFKESIYEELNLAPEQKSALEENRKQQRQDLEKIFSAMKEKRAKLQEELKKPEVSRANVDPIVDEIKSLQGQLIDQKIKGIFAVKSTLTPEQFSKFQEMAEEKQSKRKQLLQGLRKKVEERKGASSPVSDKN